MRVSPACELPSYCYQRKKKPGKLIIVNLQKTNYDEYCDDSGGFRIGAKIDDLFQIIMKQLGIKVEPFKVDKMLASLTDAMKRIKIDPNFVPSYE